MDSEKKTKAFSIYNKQTSELMEPFFCETEIQMKQRMQMLMYRKNTHMSMYPQFYEVWMVAEFCQNPEKTNMFVNKIRKFDIAKIMEETK